MWTGTYERHSASHRRVARLEPVFSTPAGPVAGDGDLVSKAVLRIMDLNPSSATPQYTRWLRAPIGSTGPKGQDSVTASTELEEGTSTTEVIPCPLIKPIIVPHISSSAVLKAYSADEPRACCTGGIFRDQSMVETAQ